VAQLYPRALGPLYVCLLGLAGLRWRYSNPPRICMCIYIYISKSKSLYDWRSVGRSVSQYVLVSSILVGLATRFYFLSECWCREREREKKVGGGSERHSTRLFSLYELREPHRDHRFLEFFIHVCPLLGKRVYQVFTKQWLFTSHHVTVWFIAFVHSWLINWKVWS
jgi:hypothetical protein